MFSVLLALSMLLSACAPAASTPEAAKPAEPTAVVVQDTQAAPAAPAENTPSVEQQAAPTEAPTEAKPAATSRKGAWLDELTFVSENSPDVAVTRLNAKDLDVYAYTLTNAGVFKTVKSSPDLVYTMSYGSTYQFQFNPAGPVFKNGKLNPFAEPKIREAMNYLVDRNYVSQEIMNGLAIPKLLPIIGVFPDAARYVDVVDKLMVKYAYDPEKTKTILNEEMPKIGAEMGSDGKWQYKGKPVEVIFLIRTEDERKPMGNYFATQLESVGFTVDRQEKKKAEAAPIWLQSDPNEGQWHVYTGSNIWTRIDRDAGQNFDAFYTTRGGTESLYQNMKPSKEFDEISLKLSTNNFKDMNERRELFSRALELAAQDSIIVSVCDATSYTPRRKDVTAVGDLAASIESSDIWPYTLRWADKEGGSLKVAQPGILTQPWNPLTGGNFVDDQFPIRGTGEKGVIFDPYTGITMPERIEKAEVTALEGLPVTKSTNWMTLNTASEIKVPEDAWVDWDAKAQKFITSGEKNPGGATAKVKIVVTYPKDLFTTVKWHDGSPLSVADFVYGMIINWDQPKKDSPIYDEAAISTIDAFMSHFKGVRITSTDPLTIETYEDAYQLDAEWMVSRNYLNGMDGASWWPFYTRGEGAWHNIAVAAYAEADKKLAMSAEKADALKVEWTNMISGPSLEILKTYLDKAAAEDYIPYANTLSKYITADEAKARWANLGAWYDKQGHFWIGTGVYYLDKVYPVEKTLTLKRNPDFPDASDKWSSRFADPKIAEVTLDGPGQVKAGEEVTFDVNITYNGEPYANADISAVKFLVFNAKGDLVLTEDAKPVQDGLYQVALSKDFTAKLEPGSNKLEVAVSPSVVSIPAFASMEFVSVP
jgi:peptide/nickel transport system substrate-binding protein